ncbi:glycine oxidase ThiO [Rubripirellula amarantea]|nr:glycine oxidase ThiO [Rubripirellula amarantea]
MQNRITIIGGGVIGLSLAWEMSKRGCAVTVLDQGSMASATSWTATGILPPANFELATDPLDQLRGLSHRLYPEWSQQLQTLTGIDIGLRRCGGWYLADSAGERAAMIGMRSYWEDLSIDCESVEISQLAEREPELASWAASVSDVAAWWVPDEHQIRPPRLLSALIAACRKSGVELIENCRVSGIQSSPADSIVNIKTDKQTYQCDDVVVCSGAWSGQIAEQLQLQQSIIPIRGQILLLKTERPLLKAVLNLGNRYIVAREDGYTLVGSCEQEAGFNPVTQPDIISGLDDFAVSMLPSLKSATRVKSWAGLRPMTFDGFPMIGRVPNHKHIYVAAGHYRSGIHLAPATAVTLASAILNQPSEMELDAFRIGKQQTR